MPRIPEHVLKCTFYLYHSEEAARDGAPFGGTGFLVGVPNPDPPHTYWVYGVTNWHTAARSGASVIRINKVGGGVDIFDLDPSEWMFRPGRHDVAIVDFPISKEHDITFIPIQSFLTEDLIEHHKIGPGEDVFMVGRFVDHDGGDSNVPSVRFGNISVMPQIVEQPTGGREESYILDMHSRTGYSGSPVFAYRTHGADFTVRGLSANPAHKFLKFLGIHWGQFQERWKIGTAPEAADMATLSAEAKYVIGMSGMTMCVPAWAILDLLEIPDIRKTREIGFRRDSTKYKASIAVPEVAEPGVEEKVTPTGGEDFSRLLNVVVKTKPQGD